MNNSLIINARHHLRWYQRLMSDASTAVMWGGWLYLWRPIFSTFSWLTSLGASVRPFAFNVIGDAVPTSLEGSAVALLGTSSTLLLWSLLPMRKACPAQTVHSTKDYATHFGLSEQQILTGRATSVCTVHHDDHGRIVHIEVTA